MLLESLSLKNFRNYKTLQLHFEPCGHLFLGENAQGKTNLIEAIHYLCMARSPRNANEQDLIRHSRDYFFLKGVGIVGGSRRVTVEIFSTRDGKRRLKINGSAHRKVSDLLDVFSVVNLSPEDVTVVGGAPRQRRRFLNYCICQVSSSYWRSLTEYQRIVQQRNMAIKSRHGTRWRAADADELEAWDQQLVAVGSRIMVKRLEFVNKMDPQVNRYHQKVSHGDEHISVNYDPSFQIDAGDRIEPQFQRALDRLREREFEFGMTLVGPHRDDVRLLLNGIDLRTFGSQGQQRTAAVALKLAAARFLEETRGEQPILLLDDVFAELDGPRTRLVFNELQQFGQCFIATAKESDLAGCGHDMRRLLVANGTVTEAP